MFEWAGDLNGHKDPLLREFYIPSSTAVKRGEPLYFTPGTGIVKISEAEAEDFDTPPICVANEAHDGSTTGRQSGTRLECSYSPTAIYRYNTLNQNYILTGGSTTTAVIANLVPATNSLWKGGKIRIVSCAADSSLNGRIVNISDSTGAGGTITLAETLPSALAAADTINIVPGKMIDDTIGYDLWYNATTSSGGTALLDLDFCSIQAGNKVVRVLYANPDTFDVYIMFQQSLRNS